MSTKESVTMGKKIRMADIAEKLDVSVVSVSKALAGKEGVGKEIRQKILDTAKEMGYIKTEAVKEEATNGIIGILVADRFFSDNTFYSSMYRTLLLNSTKAGFSVMLEIVSAEDERNCVPPKMITSNMVDGIIFMGEIDRNYLYKICESGLPYILLDFYDDEMNGDSVCSDNNYGAYKLTSYLLEHGYSKIGFVGNLLSTSSILDRYLGYHKALLRKNISLRDDWMINDRDEEGKFIELSLPEEMPEAFICSCDEVAYNLVNQLRAMGIRVPEDVGVAGYDDFRYSTLSDPPLTTYRVNVDAMGETTVSRLVKKIKRKNYIQGCVIVNGTLVIRKSTEQRFKE